MTISGLRARERDEAAEPTLAELQERLRILRDEIRKARERYGLPRISALDGES